MRNYVPVYFKIDNTQNILSDHKNVHLEISIRNKNWKNHKFIKIKQSIL